MRRTPTIVLLATMAVGAVVLSLSDRVPALLDAASAALRSLGRRLEAGLSVDLLDREDIPWSADHLAHLGLWAAVMVVAGVVLRDRVRPTVVALVLLGVSTGLEVAQAVFTSSRSVSLADAGSNLAGIGAGLGVLLAGDAIWRILSAIGDHRRIH